MPAPSVPSPPLAGPPRDLEAWSDSARRLGHDFSRLPAPGDQANANAPIQGFFSRKDLGRYWQNTKDYASSFSKDDLRRYQRGALNYLNPRNYFGKDKGAQKVHDAIPDELIAEINQSLKVVAPHKASKPNEVSLSDRDDISRRIQNAYIGRNSGIGIDTRGISKSSTDPKTDALKARGETTRDLVRIARTGTGREIIRDLEDTAAAKPKQDLGATIRPYDDNTLREGRDPNTADTEPTDPDALEKNRPSGSLIRYLPTGLRGDRYARTSREQRRLNPWLSDDRGDISLYHELVHSHHYQRGATPDTVADPKPTIPAHLVRHPVDQGGDPEEYRAVGLLPAYSRDRHNENRFRRELRALGENAPDRTTYAPIEEDSESESDSGGEDEKSSLLRKRKTGKIV